MNQMKTNCIDEQFDRIEDWVGLTTMALFLYHIPIYVYTQKSSSC